MKKYFFLSVLVFIAIGTVHAESTEKTVTETEITKDTHGTERTVKTTKTTDPKGLGNKSWSEEIVKTKVEANGDATEDASHTSVDSAGTSRKIDESVKREVKADGTVESTMERDVVTDPKGLGNKHESTFTRKVEEHPDGSVTTTDIINGEAEKSIHP